MLKLNEKQLEAINQTEGAVLVLAGAGSGKTRVLTQRVAYLLEDGKAKPWEILAITFTNKAAAEMRERIAETVEFDIRDMWISTFHSMCVRMLRRYADVLGYSRSFLIYDTADTLSVIKRILDALNLKDDKRYGDKYMRNLISRYKNDESALEFGEYATQSNPFIEEYAQEIYDRYLAVLHQQNAMDFDDLLLNAYAVLETNEEARTYYQHKFKYVLVDEYQDTNMVQYKLVKILAEGYGNLFVVGDDDQSIYAFRGANIRNILEFEKDFSGAKVIRLEQNYRSDKRILDVANCIIKNNEGRKGKTLWSDIDGGSKPTLFVAENERDEAMKIAQDIQQISQMGVDFKDMAVLYRVHTLSRAIEEKLRLYSIPYRVYGGTSFYARKEVKDILAYLYLIVNPAADTHLLRIINVPKRGIGGQKIATLRDIAAGQGIPMMEVIKNADVLVADKALQKKAHEFYDLYEKISENYENTPVPELIERTYNLTGYRRMLEDEQTLEANMRMENIEELVNSAYTPDGEEAPSLDSFLQNVTLITDLDSMDEEGGVTLMTMHAAKGLEFDVVYIAGMDESIFPGRRSAEEENIEEERRLCYVAVTRAKKKLLLLHSQVRTVYGRTQPSLRSRFLDEIDGGLINEIGPAKKQAAAKKAENKEFFSGGMKREKITPKAVSGDFGVGTVVAHKMFGKGTIQEIKGDGDSRVATVDFDTAGKKKMFLAFASLEIVN